MNREHRNLPSQLLGCLTAVLLLSTSSVQAAVYRCDSGDGPVLYSQFQCPAHSQQQTLNPSPQNLIAMPHLSAAELAALRRLENDLNAQRTSAQRQRRRQRGQAAARLAASRKICAKVKNDLKTLAAQRRDGYSAAEGRRLNRRQAELRQLRKANCAGWQ